MRLGYKAHEGSYNVLGVTNRMAGVLLDQRRYLQGIKVTR